MQRTIHSLFRLFFLMMVLVVQMQAATNAQDQPPVSPPAPKGHIDMPPQPDTVLGTISGCVMLDNSQPAVGFKVGAYEARFPGDRFPQDNPNTTVTDQNGRYTITVRQINKLFIGGPFRDNVKGYDVFVNSDGKDYVAPPEQNVDLDAKSDHAVTGFDFVMRLGPEVVVRVHDAITGAPVPGLKIHADNDTQDRITGSDGTLRFRVPFTNIRLEATVPEDQQHTLAFAPGYGGGEQTYQETTGVPGKDFVWDLKTYGTTQKSDWHGIVLGLNGRPVPDVPVTILRANSYPRATVVRTDISGQFSIQMPRLDESEQVTQGYSDPPVIYARFGSLAAAQLVTPDESWNGMTLHLAPGASVSGILTDLKGNPAAGVGVSVTGMILGVFWFEPTQPVSVLPPDAVTNKQGFFTLTGLPPGNYQVHASGGGYGNLAFPPPVSSPTTMVQPRLALTLGERKYMGTLQVPHADKILTGKVVDTHGQPAQRLFVRVTGAHTDQTAATQDDGTFQVNDVVDEPVTVEVGVPDHEATAQVVPGQTSVRLVAAPDVVATNGLGTAPVLPPSGPVTVGIQGK